MTLLSKLIPLFIITPLVELAILIQVGKLIGAWETVGLVVITGIHGAVLAQMEGLRIWGALQAELMQGKMPTNRLMDGVLILVGGLLLLTPGILTDILGFSLIIPFTRPLYRNWLKNKFKGKISAVNFNQSRKQAEVEVIEKLDNK